MLPERVVRIASRCISYSTYQTATSNEMEVQFLEMGDNTTVQEGQKVKRRHSYPVIAIKVKRRHSYPVIAILDAEKSLGVMMELGTLDNEAVPVGGVLADAGVYG